MDLLREDFCLKILLEVSGIRRSSYYKWKKNINVLTKRKQANLNISERIKLLYVKHKGCYGVDRMTHALLNDYKLVVNHKHVYRLMKEHGYLAVIKPKKYFKQPQRRHSGVNILNRNFQASYPFDKLATDVSVIKKSGKSIYISPIKNLCTNMIEGWDISYNGSLKIAINPLLSIKDKALPEGTFMHSDQGGLYTSGVFKKILEENNFIQSLSRKGTPIDNSPMESFFGTLKSEMLYNPLIKLHNDIETVAAIEEYFSYYNNDRIQKKLGYLIPAQYKEIRLKKYQQDTK
ncbi:IS3 family transposase [Clostridium psychrophilum]|uniref:IS3 family transposase n=1 Tax=Clostridium psychrophilum TaxID=132926 RepID=UPI0028AE2439|nr:IS3 family transposase [Clostridium psychrophilum]